MYINQEDEKEIGKIESKEVRIEREEKEREKR